MWDLIWPRLTAEHVVRVDLRGFGGSTTRPTDHWSPRGDMIGTMDALGIGRAHLVAARSGPGCRWMQRLAFTITLDWDDIHEELEEALDPAAPERYGEIVAPTLVLIGDLDLDAIRLASDLLVAGLSDVREIRWRDTAHLPSIERPAAFADLIGERVTAYKNGSSDTSIGG